MIGTILNSEIRESAIGKPYLHLTVEVETQINDVIVPLEITQSILALYKWCALNDIHTEYDLINKIVPVKFIPIRFFKEYKEVCTLDYTRLYVFYKN